MKKMRVTSLATAALATMILAGTNFTNNEVKADTKPANDTTANAKTAEENAQANVESAQKDVDNAQSDLDSAESALDQVQIDAVKPDQAYADQDKVVELAKNNFDSKTKALNSANAEKKRADQLVTEANKPGAINEAKKAISDKKADILNKKDAVKDAQDKILATQKAVADAKKDVANKQNDLKNKQTSKAEADQKVRDAENALNHTNFDQVKNKLKNANSAVSKDAEDINSVTKKIENNQAEVNKTKNNIPAAKEARDAANTAKDQAQRNYDAKKNASEKSQSDLNQKTSELADLQNKLSHVNELITEQNKNNIIIHNLEAYRKAYAHYMSDNDLTDEDKAYLDSAINDNKYVSSAKAAQEKIDPNNLSDEQIEELSLFSVHLFNQLRKQFGFAPNDVVTKGAIDFAKKVTAAYRNDKWSIGEHEDHYCEAINKIAGENGLKTETEISASDDESENESSQPYELAFTSGNLPDSFRNDQIQVPNGMDGVTFAPQTMDDLRRYVYVATNSMIFGSGEQYEFDHARGILGAIYDSPEIIPENGQSDLKDKIDEVKESLSTDPDDFDSLPNKLEHAKAALVSDKGYLKQHPKLADYYKENIKKHKEEIEKLNQQIEAKKQELNHLESLSNQETSYPHYVATDFASGIPFSEVGTDSNSETQVHFLNGMSPEFIKDKSKFDLTEVPSYEKQAETINGQISDINKSLEALKVKVSSLSNDTEAAKNALDKANNDLITKQNALDEANAKYNAAKNALKEAIKEEKNLKAKQKQDLASQKRAQASFEAFQGNHEQLVARYNAAVQNQKSAENAVHNAEHALITSQNSLQDAQKAQRNLNENIAKKEQAVSDAQNQLKQLQNHESDLERAPQILKAANQAQIKAQKEYNTAKKQVAEAEAALKKLQPAKDAADAKVSEAQAAVDSAKSRLADAQTKLANAKKNLEKIQAEQKKLAIKNSTKVEKASKKSVKKAVKKLGYKRIVLTHNAFVYNKAGKAIKKGLHIRLVRKGASLKALNNAKLVTIKGKKFYQIGKNEFIKAANAKLSTKSIHIKARIKGAKKVRAFDRSGKLTKSYLKAKKTYSFNEKATIKGKTYYKVAGKNLWIPASKLALKK